NLPVKIKTAKVKKRYFNFLVFLDGDHKTVLEKRKGKGIWQNLYQFPLVETSQETTEKAFGLLAKEHPLVKEVDFELLLYNSEAIVHKLSHQHLYTRFWIVKTDISLPNGIPTSQIRNYAVPVLIGNFIEAFNFQ